MEELLKCTKCGGDVFYPRARLRVAKESIKRINLSIIKGEGIGHCYGKVPDNPGEGHHRVVGHMDVLVCEVCGTMVGEGGEKDEDRTSS